MCILCATKKIDIINEKLTIGYCEKNEVIPKLLNVKKLKLYYNINLKFIENIENIEELDIVECPLLIKLPKLKKIKRIQIRKCERLMTTFDPFNIALSTIGIEKINELYKKIHMIDKKILLPNDIIDYILLFIID